MFGAFGSGPGSSCLAFVSRLCRDQGVAAGYGLRKRIDAVQACRKLGKKDMQWNDATPRITVDPETYAVTADGLPLVCQPVRVLPLAQRYSLF
jgi:urease alpha subunit